MLVHRWFQRRLTGLSDSQHRPQRIDRCTAAWLQRKRRNDPARARSKAKRCEASPLAPGREADLITIFKEAACFPIGKRKGQFPHLAQFEHAAEHFAARPGYRACTDEIARDEFGDAATLMGDNLCDGPIEIA